MRFAILHQSFLSSLFAIRLVAEVFIVDSAMSVLCRSTVWLSTAPTQPLTHWYQVRCLLQDPVFARCSETLVGCVHLRSNTRYVSTGTVSQSPCLSRRTVVSMCYQCGLDMLFFIVFRNKRTQLFALNSIILK